MNDHDKIKAEGDLKENTGEAKENLGEATGDRDLEAEGAAERAEGLGKQVAGETGEHIDRADVRDEVRDELRNAVKE